MKVPNPGSGSCPRCRGEHPECASCPNGEAARDDSFDAATWTREKRPCWYAHLGARPCGGYGHQAKHHAPLYTEIAKKAVEDRVSQKGKGKKGKGGASSCVAAIVGPAARLPLHTGGGHG